MIAPARYVAAALVVGAVVVYGEKQNPPATRPAQTFRTRTDVVFVDVSVREGGRMVPGLTAGDFVLTDNGVRQRIEAAEATAVPIDLTLVVDLSGDPSGPWTARRPVSKITAELQAEVAGIARLLRPTDRMRLLAIDRHVLELAPFSPPASVAPVRRVEFDGLPALHDTLAAALIQPVEPARRHVVVARTKGNDAISSIDAAAVGAIAERSDALLHLVVMETALDTDDALKGFQCALMGLCMPTRQFWVPFQRRLTAGRPVHQLMNDGQILATASEATGGGLHKTEWLNEPTLTGTFKRAFEDFRASYMLRYTPEGVPHGGWHTIEVKVPGRSYTVRARRGYGVEEATATPPLATLPEVPRTLADFTSAYERAAYEPVVLALRQVEDPARLLRDFSEAGNPWPAAPRREAALALELAEAALFAPRTATREEALKVVDRFARLIRHPLEPDTFERYWYFAALTLLEGLLRPAETQTYVDRALARFPGEPRFVLSRAIAADQRWSSRVQGRDPAGPDTPIDADTVRGHYEAAIALPGTSAEARIRLAYLLHRLERHDEALEQLTRAGAEPVAEPALRYLRQLFLGHVLGALGRHDEAVTAYREARGVAPAAQSARVALMNALLLHGDREGAESLAEAIQTETSNDFDPWWLYWQGQYRLYPYAMARVRELIR